MKINMRSATHDFQKVNLVTLQDRTGMYDLYKCVACGLTGKRYGFDAMLTVSDRVKTATENCPKAKKINKIRITFCTAQGKVFANLTPGSEHKVIEAPEGEPNNLAGVWVMGVGEPVKVLTNEYEEVDDETT